MLLLFNVGTGPSEKEVMNPDGVAVAVVVEVGVAVAVGVACVLLSVAVDVAGLFVSVEFLSPSPGTEMLLGHVLEPEEKDPFWKYSHKPALS